MIIFSEKIKADAVIFDFDGVIVDTEPLHYKAFQQILVPQGMGYSWEQYKSTYMGFDDRDAFQEVYAINRLTIDVDELTDLIAVKAAIFQEIIRSGITAYPGAVELVKALHRTKIPLAICSGALRSDIVPILEMLDIKECFDIIVSADNVSKSKPDPESYHLAFDQLSNFHPKIQISKIHTVAIEDTPAGITSATDAGLMVIAITNSYSKEYLTKADYITDSLENLVSKLTDLPG